MNHSKQLLYLQKEFHKLKMRHNALEKFSINMIPPLRGGSGGGSGGGAGGGSGATAAEVWANATRTLTELTNLKDAIFDAHYPSTLITSSSSADVFTSYSEIFADVGVDKTLQGIEVTHAGTQGGTVEVQIATGAAASEVLFYRFDARFEDAIGIVVYPSNRVITDNARISVRLKDTRNIAIAYGILVLVS